MCSVASSEDLVPLIFCFLPPSSYVACSLISSLWEITSCLYIYQHITALRSITFAQSIALFSSHWNLVKYVCSCCFHYSIPASAYNQDNVDIFIQYILSTCTNLVALTVWDVSLDGEQFTLLPKGISLQVLTFQNCSGQFSALKKLLECCMNTQLLQISNSVLFCDDCAYHHRNLPVWLSEWIVQNSVLSKPAPISILIQSPQQQMSGTFWHILQESIDISKLTYLKLLPHLNDGRHAANLVTGSLRSLQRLETTVLGK